MKPKSSFALFLFLIDCLLIPGLIRWSLQNEFQVFSNVDPIPLSEFEYEEYAPDLSNGTMISRIEANADSGSHPPQGIFTLTQQVFEIFLFKQGLRSVLMNFQY